VTLRSRISLLESMVRSDLRALRDSAIFLFIYVGGPSREQVSRADMEQIEFTATGYVVHDEDRDIVIAKGRTKHCPVRAMRDYLEASGHTTGSIFRNLRRGARQHERLSPHGVAQIVRNRFLQAGITRDHSITALKKGFRHEARRAGARDLSIQRQHGLRSGNWKRI
jgi:site-specific recombinase XerD